MATSGPVRAWWRAWRAATGPPGPDDALLLERYALGGDGDAFAALVERHGPLVWGVCRRLLPQVADAEDAFQATFLVLARKAPSVRRSGKVRSWLYTVALRVARRARATAQRRQMEPLPDPPPAAPDRSVPDPEVCAVVAEEVGRLPERYRLAVLLCDLEGRTYADAARQLGCPPGTVATRLSRARAKLRDRLTRRGVTAGAGVLATAIVPPAAVQAARGSPAIVALAEGVIRDMTSRTLTRFTAAAILLFIGAAGIGIFARSPSTPPPAAGSPATAQVARPVTHPISISGTVTDTAGKPIAAAKVYLLSLNSGFASVGASASDKFVVTTVTDAKGRYEFKDLPLPAIHSQADAPFAGKFQVCATAKDFGLAWQGTRIFTATPPPPQRPQPPRRWFFLGDPIVQDVTLGPAASLHGQLLEDGRPLAGAEVRLHLADYLDQRGRGPQDERLFEGLYSLPELGTVRTDEHGRFAFHGLPADAFFWIWLGHLSLSKTIITFYAATTAGPIPADVERIAYSWSKEPPPILTGELTISLAHPRPVLVRVVDAKTGKPVAGIRIDTTNQSGPTRIGSYPSTDADGRATLHLPPGEYRYVLDPPRPPPPSDYVRTDGLLTVTTAERPGPVAWRISRGCILQLEVIDAATGQGVPGATFLRKVKGQLKPIAHSASIFSVNESSDAFGRMRAVVSPGTKCELTAQPPEGYELVNQRPDGTPGPAGGVKTVDLPAGETVKVRFLLRKK